MSGARVLHPNLGQLGCPIAAEPLCNGHTVPFHSALPGVPCDWRCAAWSVSREQCGCPPDGLCCVLPPMREGWCKQSKAKHEFETCSVIIHWAGPPMGAVPGISNVVSSCNSRLVHGWCGVELAFNLLGCQRVQSRRWLHERAPQSAFRPQAAPNDCSSTHHCSPQVLAMYYDLKNPSVPGWLQVCSGTTLATRACTTSATSPFPPTGASSMCCCILAPSTGLPLSAWTARRC